MRFAGSRIEGLLGDRPDYGATVSNASTLRSREGQAITDAMGKTAAAGINAAGKAESAKITGSAASALARAQGQAAVMEGIGQIGGAAIGAIPTGGGLGSSYDFKFDSSNAWNQPADTGGFSYWS